MARAAAIALGIAITGTLGVLRRAKRRGVVAAVRPILVQMQANGLYVAEPLAAAFLRDMDE